MLARSSLYRKISTFILLFLLTFSLSQCKADSVWGVPVASFRQRLQSGRIAFLRELEVERRELDELFRLSPGAPFYLSFHYSELGCSEMAERLMRLQWRRGQSPWREEAARLLLAGYLREHRYPEAQVLAEQLLRGLSGEQARYAAERGLVEALYWQSRDEEVLERLEGLRETGGSEDGELELFAAVSGYRLGKAGWQVDFEKLFFRRKSSSLHTRAVAFLEQEHLLQSFPPAAVKYFQAKDLLYRGQSRDALELLEASISNLGTQPFAIEMLIEELGAAYFAAGEHIRGARFLLQLGQPLERSKRLDAVEMAGRLYRKEGLLDEAQRLLDEVIRETGSAEQRDRAIWFALDVARTRSEEDFLQQIEILAPRWRQPPYFGDIIDSEVSHLLAQKQWQSLLRLYRALRGLGPEQSLARLSYILGRLASLDLLAQPDAGAALSGNLSPQVLFLEARASGGEGYHGLLAAAILKSMGFPIRWPGEENGPKSSDPDLGNPGIGEREDGSQVTLIRGFLEYGLSEQAFQYIQESWRSLPPELLYEAAGVLQDRGAVLSSLRVMNLYLYRKKGGADREEMLLLYPRAFAEGIEKLAAAEGIPPAVFFALVREESYFDPEIVSPSGAVGLTQLMPETAGDAARRLRLQEYDLRDPEHNLRLGAGHLSRILVRLADIPKTLIAYNAGLSRLRSWERSFSKMPTDLLVEALPYPETRNYVHKILVSAAYYGVLYYGQSLEETVFLFFPALDQAGEEKR